MDVAALDGFLEQQALGDAFAGVARVDHDPPDGEPRVLLERGYGLASRRWGVPCTPDIRFDTASITKLFTAVATAQQVDAGAFTLTTRVTDYLGLEGTQISPEVTVYHLLTHTSGIGDDADEEAGERYEDLFVDKPNYSIRQTSDFLPGFVDKAPNFPPGQGCRYCNVAYVLLGLMVERATGQGYRDYVARHVFEPAGMTGAVFASSDEVTPRIAEGADPVRNDRGELIGWRRNIFAFPPVGSPDAGAHVTAADLMAFHRAVRSGRLMSEHMTAQLLRPHELHRRWPSGEHLTGFGFEFSTNASGVVDSYWKEGTNAGVSAVLAHYPLHDVTLVVLGAIEDCAWEPWTLVDRMLGVGGDDAGVHTF